MEWACTPDGEHSDRERLNLQKGGAHMGTAIVLLVVLSAVGFAVRSMIKDKKAGKSLQCGGDCKHCGGHCH